MNCLLIITIILLTHIIMLMSWTWLVLLTSMEHYVMAWRVAADYHVTDTIEMHCNSAYLGHEVIS